MFSTPHTKISTLYEHSRSSCDNFCKSSLFFAYKNFLVKKKISEEVQTDKEARRDQRAVIKFNFLLGKQLPKRTP